MKPSSQNRQVAVVWNTTPAVWGLEKLGQEPSLELETKVHPKIRNHGEGPY